MIDFTRKRRILITGASGGIGSAIASLYLQREWEVFAQFNTTPPGVVGVTAIKKDLSLPGAGEEIVDAVRPHLVINSAADQSVFAIDEGLASIHERAMEMLSVNLVAPLEIMRAASRHRTELCINISSIEALNARPGHALYGASKAALESLTRTAAVELAPMRVLGLRLGLISRPGLEEAWPEGVSAWNQAVPMKRMGSAAEVARAIASIASEDFSWATGTTIDFDGGFNATPGW
ncbi:MAG: SDR family NAD(P)-dependent oxidoreductase [Candidatus Nanopelagicaceae bacterium]